MHESNRLKVAILGAGSWGIALGNHCQSIGHDVRLWEFDPVAARRLEQQRERPQVLKNIRIHDSINITNDLNASIKNAELILLVVPSHVCRSVLKQLTQSQIQSNAVIVNCAKGIEIETLKRISEIVEQELPSFTPRYAVLSGPSHAEEVAREIPTAVVVASTDELVGRFVQQSLNSFHFRIYRSRDVVGVELGGSLKNVIAIAAGICDGAGFGDNTKAALQPRGLAEMSRLGQKLGANPLTFAGLSGMGDLIVTCMSRHSRNRYLGEEIGKGKKLAHVLESMTMVAEGVRTSQAVVKLASREDVEMPISFQVFDILFKDKEPKQALHELFAREVKPEIW
ncbi:NAD(P)-dependent glycerol-3-phosphate dehydrogenase [candidate division KSB1 bacterium]|nr:NAD(P)-dependent glycerol-3-phosphate dehydrogenase [candidate division KSB1 bacterium]RQW00493.1 MAG: NAD(P)-dependent glycerol-3-phosphate dehydrogenase [candidate division KSB1 bacterium]